MTELERYQPQTVELDSWVGVMPDVVKLAEYIAMTEFVPAGLRGKPAAVAAAVLAGREQGIGPMTSLTHMHVVEGRPTMSAELKRARVLAAGHHIHYVEMTSTRCVVRGRRRGSDEWTTVTWTMDDARRAGLAGKANWQRHPRRMLQARATSELCDLLFPDVVGGMPTTEDVADDVEAVEPVEQPKRRTARRAARKTAEPDQADQPAATGDQAPPVEPARPPAMPAPPLPGEPGYDEPGAPAEPVEPEQRAQAEPEPAEPISDAQMRKLGATFTRIGISDRGERLRVSATLVGRPLMTSRELTRREASTLIDTLATVADQPDAAARLRAMVAELENAGELLAESTDADDGEPVDGELVDDPAPTSGGPVDWPPVTQPGTG
ncbi:hypothetical protein [uncultured Thermomonospora sp.]|uniref:hypothetical protein n=1 Tax=uncultured Thermomonospora sp. TaxID=671175 RepID=UPI00259B76C5|nr:hypothetical protein [uncultured Thermomonospora sp.]